MANRKVAQRPQDEGGSGTPSTAMHVGACGDL